MWFHWLKSLSRIGPSKNIIGFRGVDNTLEDLPFAMEVATMDWPTLIVGDVPCLHPVLR